jgi:hypothetical protein
VVRKLTEGGEARMVAEFQRRCYHNSTVPVKEYLEVIEKMGDRGRGRENRKVKWKRGGERVRTTLSGKRWVKRSNGSGDWKLGACGWKEKKRKS